MTDCAACQARSKTWEDVVFICSFPDSGEFTEVGWNCATASMIRNLSGQDEDLPFADHRYYDDQNYSTILISDLNIPMPITRASALWMSWYKHRGRTEAMWLLSEYDVPRKPTEADILAIVEGLRT
jgi:hypothetical protein